MVKGLEDRGHACSLLLYDRHGSDISQAKAIIRRHWPWLRADVSTVPNVIEGYDACVASSWETAHVLATRSAEAAVHRFYFIQDYEPFFYPRGSLYSLAEDSYRFGFTNISLGNMVSDALRENIGITAATVPFGCDGGTYLLENLGPREGVVFYAREAVDRRGTFLGKLALAEFHQRHPEQRIHVYGDPLPSWTVPHQHHGKLAPAQLNLLYNNSVAGLALSFTNISLVAEEMLSCGTTPIVNDHPLARKDLAAPGVLWATATPAGIANALCRAVEKPLAARELSLVAAGARRDWVPAQTATAAIIEEEATA
ncbi:glycosyltransferase family 1 protein [Arthrobacter sp. ISL-85]|uniref:rhamnosyltransferase WsaF family glycosyltransferase n=1 Tax=Arthrobacter sp. ISL-85 TaxID=2819115 RepID=UPI00203547DA|nr:glycosyltransferase family 1 protein [Arthrobacter sp. ISL-85]